MNRAYALAELSRRLHDDPRCAGWTARSVKDPNGLCERFEIHNEAGARAGAVYGLIQPRGKPPGYWMSSVQLGPELELPLREKHDTVVSALNATLNRYDYPRPPWTQMLRQTIKKLRSKTKKPQRQATGNKASSPCPPSTKS